jgi:hypothetical protein
MTEKADLLAVKALLDSIQGDRPIRSDLADQIRQLVERRELNPLPLMRFTAEIVKFADTFKTKGASPIYAMAFATPEPEHLNRWAVQVGLDQRRKVLITIQTLGGQNTK